MSSNVGVILPGVRPVSWWRKKWVRVVAQILVLVGLGAAAAALKRVEPGLGIPGSSAPLWLPPLVFSRTVVNRQGTASVVGISMALWGIPLGLNHELSYNLGLHGGTGIAIDLIGSLPWVKVTSLFGAILSGTFGHMSNSGL